MRRYNWRPFEEARAFARSLALKSKEEWGLWARSDARPIDIPKVPIAVYEHKGWISWGDWLGTRNKKGGFRLFGEARTYVRSLLFKNQYEGREWAKSGTRPDKIPAAPDRG